MILERMVVLVNLTGPLQPQRFYVIQSPKPADSTSDSYHHHVLFHSYFNPGRQAFQYEGVLDFVDNRGVRIDECTDLDVFDEEEGDQLYHH